MKAAGPSVMALGVTVAGVTGLEALANEDFPRFAAHDWFIGPDYEPLLTAFARHDSVPGFETRCEALVVDALADMLTRLPKGTPQGTCTVVLVLPEICVVLPEHRLELLAKHLLAESVGPLREAGLIPSRRLYGFGGNAGAWQALEEWDRQDSLIVVAVDSYADADRLDALASRRALFCKENPFGRIPGEACGVMYLRRAASEGIRLQGAATAIEPVREGIEGQPDCAALSDVCRIAVGEGASRQLIATDWNNSRYRASELGLVVPRLTPDVLDGGAGLSRPALDFGDIGAASAPVALAWLLASRAGWHHALIMAGSEYSGQRAAAAFDLHHPGDHA